jgi:isoleucyl-tRNA synthetase
LLCFTADEVWTHLPAPHLREKSVHLAKFVAPADLRTGLSAEHLRRAENWPRLIAVRNEVLKALEVARQEKFIGGSLEAHVRLGADGDLAPLLEAYGAFLPGLFIVSQVSIGAPSVDGVRSIELPGLTVKVEKAAGSKCERCWNYSQHVGDNARYPTVCERCSTALAEIEAAGLRSSI